MYLKSFLIYIALVFFAITALQNCNERNSGDLIYFTSSSELDITGVYIGENPIRILINGEPIILGNARWDEPIQVPSTVFNGGEIRMERPIKLEGTPETLPFAIQDTVTKKDIHSGIIRRDESGVYRLRFGVLNGKSYDDFKTVRFGLGGINLSDNAIDVIPNNPQFEATVIPANGDYFGKQYAAYFGGDEIISFTLKNQSGAVIGTKILNTKDFPDMTGNLYGETEKINFVVVTGETGEAKMVEPTTQIADANHNKIGIYMYGDMSGSFDMDIFDFSTYDVMGNVFASNLYPNRWNYLSVANIDFPKESYAIAYLKTGTNEFYLGDEASSSYTDVYTTPMFPEDNKNGYVMSFFIYITTWGTMEAIKL